MNPSFNIQALEMIVKVCPETEDKFDDNFWENTDWTFICKIKKSQIGKSGFVIGA